MPKVYDKNGHELTVGARVERVFPNGRTGGLPGTVVEITRRHVSVEWDRIARIGIGSIKSFEAERINWLGPGRQRLVCDDLLRIDSPTEGKEG